MTVIQNNVVPVAFVGSSEMLATRADVERLVTELGAAEGRGGQSRIAFAMALVRAASLELLETSDAAAMYDVYEAGRKAGRTRAAISEGTETDDTADETDPTKAARSRSVQISKLGSFIAAGAISQGEETCNAEAVLERCMVLCKRADVKTWDVRMFDAMKATAVAIVKAGPKHTLSDEEILNSFRPKDKEPKNIADRLAAVIKTLKKIQDSGDHGSDCTKLGEAITALEISHKSAVVCLGVKSLRSSGIKIDF